MTTFVMGEVSMVQRQSNVSTRSAIRFTIFFCLCLVLLALSMLNEQKASYGRSEGSRGVRLRNNGSMIQKDRRECREVHKVPKQCEFVQTYCQDDEAGLLSYLSLYYCGLAESKPLAFTIIIAWLGILFASIGISASDFLCINLATISNMLGMSETLAGVTFLAFGNGSPDVFSTWAAFTTHNGSLAVGELVGAAGFITTVIAGSMAIVKPFRVSRKSFVRDAFFFTIAAAFSMVFLIDGRLSLWESAIMVIFYLVYVLTVLLWHSVAHRRKRKRDRQTLAREHFEISGAASPVALSRDPSSIGPGYVELHNTDGAEADSQAQSGLNFGQSGLGDPEDEDDDEEDRRERFLAEVGQQIRRTHRRTLSRMANSHQPIRPSLLGALEFGSLITSLERSSNQQDIHRTMRRHSEDASAVLNTGQRQAISSHTEHLGVNTVHEDRTDSQESHSLLNTDLPFVNRARSASANAIDGLEHRVTPLYNISAPPVTPQASRLSIPMTGQYLAPARNSGMCTPVPAIAINDALSWQPDASSPSGESVVLPFPAYTDDAAEQVDHTPVEILNTDVLPRWSHANSSARRRLLSCGFAIPPWLEVRRTLFPTFEDWKAQTTASRFLSVITAPTIFLLTVTIPVVHVDSTVSTGEPTRVVVSNSSISKADRQEQVNFNSSSDLTGEANAAPDSVSSADPLSPVVAMEGRNGDADMIDPGSTRLVRTETPPVDIPSTQQNQELFVSWKPWLVSIQLLISPLFLMTTIFPDNLDGLADYSLWIGTELLTSVLLLVLFLLATKRNTVPKWHNILAFPGFCVSIAWVSLIAGEVVGVLKTVGIITQISDAILGLTIFAVGNSLSDLLADLAIARLGYPVMALSACFGGPMLNILLGIGLGGLSLTVKKGHKHAHGGAPAITTNFEIEIGRSLVISGCSLLVTLVGLLIVVPLNGWWMDRKIGIALICLWSTTTIVNVALEILAN